MASFSAGTTFTDGVANDVTAAKLGALVNNATPTSGLIQDRTAETVTATNDTLLIGDASDSNSLKRITVANFAQTLPTAKITTGTVVTGTFGTTTSTAGAVTTGTIVTGTFGTTTSTAATITTGTIPTLVATTQITTGTGTAADPAVSPTGDSNTGLFFPAADTIAFAEGGAEAMRIDSSGDVGIGVSDPRSKLHSSGAITSGGVGANTSKSFLTQCTPYDVANENWTVLGGFDNNSARILYLGGGGWNTPDATEIRLYTASAYNQTDNAGVERLRIDSSGNVGIGTTSPVNQLEVVGSFGRGAPVTKTADFTLADTENWLIVNKGSSCTVTLPAASSWTGREFTIKVITAHTVVSASSNVIPRVGGSAGTAILPATDGAWATLVSNGTNWEIMCGS